MSRVGLRSSAEGSSKTTNENMNGKLKSTKANNKQKHAYNHSHQKNTHRNKKAIDPGEVQQDGAFNRSDSPETLDRDHISCICRVPLERLSGIMEKLSIAAVQRRNAIKTNALHFESSNAVVCQTIPESKCFDGKSQLEQEKKHKVVKLLCLYCEKQFTSHKMQAKHVEKFHTETIDRRCSERTHTSTNIRNKEQNTFVGCIYCKKLNARAVIAPEKDLYNLFVHMSDCHTDKYFACKPCIIRFPSSSKLIKHMQTVHRKLPTPFENSNEIETQSASAEESIKPPKSRAQKLQKTALNVMVASSSNTFESKETTAKSGNVVGANEPVLSRLGLTQNRLPNNKKSIRLRRETITSEIGIKQDQPPAAPVSSPTSRNRQKFAKGSSYSIDQDVVFRVPARTDIMSCVFDDNFYKEVVSNVRNNLLYHLDGKLAFSDQNEVQPTIIKHTQPPIRSTLVKSPLVFLDNSEIHAATSIAGLTAFPTLLTAEQYGGDASAKFRRPHTKHSWKWKWDSVKKFKLVNEGGKIIKKMKHPMLGLRDLSKLDMWTQLTMRQKHELQYNNFNDKEYTESSKEEKLRLNEQLNFILDRRLLPNIILEQNEQAVIKLENDDFGISTSYTMDNDGNNSILEETFADHSFLSMLNLLPNTDTKNRCRRLVLSGEWARPRCYLCMCCGTKFDKLKSLEEHKMFRHPHILSTHYEVVGRELLAGNLLCHLFIPKRALHRYENMNYLNGTTPTQRILLYKQHQKGKHNRNSISVTGEESSDSVQSISNSGANMLFAVKQSNSAPDDCDTDTKTTIEINTISPTHSMHSSNSLCALSSAKAELVKVKDKDAIIKSMNCTKCGKKCNGTLDLYRHILDCSGDYIWSLAKKRKYRYYCGSKKRRPCNKQNFALLRKGKKCSSAGREKQKTDLEENSSRQQIKTKTPPRPRASDAESIKKMLENLPPKRICKTILPTDNKNRLQKKGKLLAKHKIYNTHVLRKTRSRQLAQTSRLSNQKKKNNFNRQIKRNINTNKTNKNTKRSLNSTNLTEQREVKIENNQLPLNDEKDKTENSKVQELDGMEKRTIAIEAVMTNVLEANENNLNNVKCLEESGKSHNNECDTLPIAAKEGILQKPCDKLESTPDVKQVIDESAEAQIVLNVKTQIEQTIKTQLPKQQVAGLKRSKRISDCIAMLTGKLEQKLKTVQVVSETTCKEETERKLPVCNTIRTPKRKTVCRRIIKNDVQNIEKPIDKTSSPEIPKNESAYLPSMTEQVSQIGGNVSVTIESVVAKTVSPRSNNVTTDVTHVLSDVTMQYSPITQSPPQQAEVKIQNDPISVPQMTPHPKPPVQMHSLGAQLQTAVIQTPLKTPDKSLIAVPQQKSQFHALGAKFGPLPAMHVETLPVYLPINSMRTTTVNNFPLLPLSNEIVPTQLTPPMASLIQPIAAPMLVTPLISTTNYCIEPLNLSSTNKQNNATQDLSVQRRSGIPARRQTICGFEAKDFNFIDDMLPLDLSKKSRYIDKSTVQLQPSAAEQKSESYLLNSNTEITPIPTFVSPSISATVLKGNAAVSATTVAQKSVQPVIPAATELVTSKQFYSNLELLKIPQISRQNMYVAAPLIELSQQQQSTTTKVATNSKKKVCPKIMMSELPMKTVAPIVGAQLQTQNVSQVQQTQPQVSTQTTIVPTQLKELAVQKKEVNTKINKQIPLKMDEEVINHIDDAINSVINAVKASLQQEEEFNALTAKTITPAAENKLESTQPNAISNQQQAQTQISVQGKQVMPPKRTMRSKTMDCRPSALSVQINDCNRSKEINSLISPPTAPNQVQIQQPQSTNLVIPSFLSDTVPKNDLHKTKKENTPAEEVAAIAGLSETKNGLNQVRVQDPKIADAKSVSDSQKLSTNATIVVSNEQPLEINEAQHNHKPNEISNCTEFPAVTDIVAPLNETNLATIPNESIEHVTSSINNTSSGFHSSVQSENANDLKKKQRRRRKNELAAIVADQLLESFKIDSARRDNLKKLENLAYEKSEDLLLTGMLLMSSTKRNAASVFGKTLNLNDNAKRNDKLDDVKNLKQKKPIDNSKHIENITSELESKKGDRRRSYRRKGRGLDNENISKLKSSLESFSIGIENKLSEYESKIANTQNNEQDNKNKNKMDEKIEKMPSETIVNNTTQINSILRPSILAPCIEPTTTTNSPSQLQTKNEKLDNKLPVFSRDPRLNKNIHKHEQQHTESGLEKEIGNVGARTRLRAAIENEKQIDDIADLDEDNYLTEIAKNVNEKIMSAENEEFISNDGFELANDMHDDSNSKFYRPPTSLSVRSAPSFNDDLSNFGSMCDDNTNTEVMDMDLDDELSVYTSYSQDIGRGRGRRRRRRRSILLKRRPKKRPGRELSAEKFECLLCKKTFFSANSLSKHNMTLAHVSKVSEQEYLQSKSMPGAYDNQNTTIENNTTKPTLNLNNKKLNTKNTSAFITIAPVAGTTSAAQQSSTLPHYSKNGDVFENTPSRKPPEQTQTSNSLAAKYNETLNLPVLTTHNIGLNSDERLFYECCSILQGNENTKKTISCHSPTGFLSYNKNLPNAQNSNTVVAEAVASNVKELTNKFKSAPNKPPSLNILSAQQQVCTEINVEKLETLAAPTLPTLPTDKKVFRDPPLMPHPTALTKPDSNRCSPIYSAISQFSAVTNNTTSRFKTKAAMKGYENEHIDFAHQRESRNCKLTELADIALGSQNTNRQKQFPPIVMNITENHTIKTTQLTNSDAGISNLKHVQQKETLNSNVSVRERPKNAETQHSSTSSKTIMHSSIIKAAVKDSTTSPKIVIPERPFKNIGLEEKESITFQKPNTTSLSLLNDENSISTGSYSDRDDYDFGTLSCDEEETNIKTTNDKVNKNSSDSSSSRATAKTFENKSLIMGRIFKNASTKAKAAPVKTVKIIGIQKDQNPVAVATAPPKADLNQLFDELRGGDVAPEPKLCIKQHQTSAYIDPPLVRGASFNSSVTTNASAAISAAHADIADLKNPTTTMTTNNTNTTITATTATTSLPSTRKTKTERKNSNAGRKNRKDISKLQSELGMSPEEIEKLIDEGQRKSKRRCATNTQRKLVEIWSSDEYEEFLSTKDIIALIEEKEQQEKRRKRKTSINTGSLHGETKEKDYNSIQSTSAAVLAHNSAKSVHPLKPQMESEFITKQNSINNHVPSNSTARYTHALNRKDLANKHNPREQQELPEINNKTIKYTMNAVEAADMAKAHKQTTTLKFKSKISETGTEAIQNTNAIVYNEHKTTTAKIKSNTKNKVNDEVRKFNNSVEDNGDEEIDNNCHDQDFVTPTTVKMQNKSLNQMGKNSKKRNVKNARANTTLPKTESASKQTNNNKKRNAVSNNYNNNNSSSNNNNNTITKKGKTNKTQNKLKSSLRRKRPASEKLYYWSSSSDEEFGRINKKRNEEYDDDGSEHYQKHGWIVGDSHKKLVTLLAIAKGNKKVDNCGVKKNIPKKKI